MDFFEAITGSRSRAEVFRLLFENPGVELYLRELQRQSGLSIRPIQMEISRLLAVGMIKMRKDGNRVYYSANTDHPLFPEIRRIVEKTRGYRALLQEALKVPEIQFAFVFGSVASGKAKAESDLDLFVIGNLGLLKLTKLLDGLSDRIGRVINPHVMTTEEFRKKFKARAHFVTRVMESPITMIVGEEDELKRLGKE